MSSKAVTCPVCRDGELAERRSGRTSTVTRAVPDVRMWQTADRRVVFECPECKREIEWRGKRIIIVDAA